MMKFADRVLQVASLVTQSTTGETYGSLIQATGADRNTLEIVVMFLRTKGLVSMTKGTRFYPAVITPRAAREEMGLLTLKALQEAGYSRRLVFA